MQQRRLTVGIIGQGRIGRRLAARLAALVPAPAVTAIFARDDSGLPPNVHTPDLVAFMGKKPDIAIECASPGILAEWGPALLAAGIDVVPLSLTAFTDRAVEDRLSAAAGAGPGRLEIPPGAIGTLGLLAASVAGGATRVVYRQVKSVEMWKRTPAAGLADLGAIDRRKVFLAGSVREIAARFPGNLNVSVGVALAGLGLDRTELELIADPAIGETAHELDIDAPPGNVRLRLSGRTVPPDGDPVDYSTFSVLRLIERRLAPIRI